MVSEVGVFFSLVFFLIGASFLASPKEWGLFLQSLADKPYSGIPLALYAIPAGLVILSFHNNWSWGFPLFITVAGWSLTVKGVVFLLFPSLPHRWMPKGKLLTRLLMASGGTVMILAALSGLSFYL